MGDSGNSFSPADFAALMNNSQNGTNAWLWIVILFFIFFGAGGFGPGRGNGGLDAMTAASAVNGGYVTNSQMNDAFNFSALERQNNETVAAVNQSKYDNIAVLKDTQASIQNQLTGLAGMEQNIIEKQQTCCANLTDALDRSTASLTAGIAHIGYQDAINTAAINANTTAQTQKILDAITGNRMADMQNQINALQLNNAMSGVVKYPMQSSYVAGYGPVIGFGYPGPGPAPMPAPAGI